MDKAPKYISKERQEEFEQFLLGQMTNKEEFVFNEKLEKEPKIQKEFEEFKSLFFAVEEEGLRKVLNDFHEALPDEENAHKNNFNFYRIAAGIAVLVALGLWLFNRPNANERLYNEYFTPDPGLPTVMGENGNYDFYEAMVDYKQGNYDLAIQKWQKLYASKPENDTLNFFIGAAHMANGNPQKSIGYLKKNQGNWNSSFSEEAKYFLALAYLNNRQIEKAKKALKDSQLEKAQKLLQELNNE